MISCCNDVNDDGEKKHDKPKESSTDTLELPNHGQSENNTMSKQDKIAWQAYCAVIRNERAIYRQPVYSTIMPSPSYLNEYLGNRNPTEQAVVDMDQDGISELILKYSYTNDLIILHYENDRVYCYNILQKNTTIYTDGSFAWENYSDNFGREFGISRISYHDGRPKYQELCRVERNYNMYYVNGTPVTEEEYDNYIENTPRTSITFHPIDTSLLNTKGNKALNLASEYWGIKNGDFDPQSGARYKLYVEEYAESKYAVYLYTSIPGFNYEYIAIAYVNIDTEDIMEIKYPNGKG